MGANGNSLTGPPLRFISLDSWRGIAALSVALLHFNAAWHGYDWTFQRFIHLFVDFFFVLSGLVIAQAYGDRLATPRGTASFLIRRFGRIWPLHAAVLLGFAAVEAAKWIAITILGMPAETPPFAEAGAVPASEFPLHLALLHGIGFTDRLTWNTPSWSISAEFWIYVIFALVSWSVVCLGLPQLRSRIMAALGLLAATVLFRSVSIHDLDLTYDGGMARCIFGFALGYLVHRIRTRLPNPAFSAFASLAEFAILILLAAWMISAAGTQWMALTPVLIAVAVYIFSFDAGPISRALQARPFQNLGLWSYSIYMVHGLVLFTLGLAVSVLERKLGIPLWQDLPHATRTVRTVTNIDPWLLDAALLAFLAFVVWISSWTYQLIEAPAREAFNRLARDLEQTTPAFPGRTVGPSGKSG